MSDYLSQVLGDDHHLDAFTCGKDPLDDWLKTQARRAQGAGTARTYVWTRPGSPDVLAYFSIAPTQVVRAEVPAKLTGGYSVIPAYLLARLALDNTLHGQGLGGQLLLDALARIVDAATVGRRPPDRRGRHRRPGRRLLPPPRLHPRRRLEPALPQGRHRRNHPGQGPLTRPSGRQASVGKPRSANPADLWLSEVSRTAGSWSQPPPRRAGLPQGLGVPGGMGTLCC